MRRILLGLCAVLTLALAVAACGGGGSSSGSTATTSSASTSTSTSTPTTSSSTSTPTTSSSSGGGEAEIKMQNIQFSPNATTVKVGQKVKWVNEDSTDHNVTAQSGADFKSKDFGKDGTFEFTPTKAGTIQYVCTLHSGMTGTLTVTG
ncbi:MAG TPA: cupredoxin domain-containing protein [Solirubrobacteraceae bacterium]